ncbi:MAG TPA: hypothetical protein VHZ24_22095 [Pirellulales bacterium]|jgi:hypothetical protein|nr:hypothetical protein [Pirellulales bacterium]
MDHRKRAAAKLGIAIALLVGGMLGGVTWAYRHVPDFYRQSLAVDETKQREANDELLAQATALVSSARKQGTWSAAFTADQINGWLAVDVPENYPDVLASGISEPRLRIEPHRATIACHYTDEKVSTVVSLDVEVALAEPNVLALKIERLRAGAMPLPLSTVIDGLSTVAADMELPLRWTKSDGAPTALLSLPPMVDQNGTQYELRTLELRAGQLVLAGRTTAAGPTGHPPTPATAAFHALLNASALNLNVQR